MDKPDLRILIREKLADGRLPHDHIPQLWGGPGNGETCDGCGQAVTKTQMVMEGPSTENGGVHFHVTCFHLWDVERQVPGHDPSEPI